MDRATLQNISDTNLPDNVDKRILPVNHRNVNDSMIEAIYDPTPAQTVVMSDGMLLPSKIESLESEVDGLREQIVTLDKFRGYFLTTEAITSIPATPNDYAYNAETGTKWVYVDDTAKWQDTGVAVPDQTVPKSSAVPLASDGGAGAVGSESAYAAGDHKHPSDATRATTAEVQTLRTQVESNTSDLESIMPELGVGIPIIAPFSVTSGQQCVFIPSEDASGAGHWSEIQFPQTPEPNESDATALFNIPTTADVYCGFKRNAESGRPMVVIHGVDNTGAENPLTITAPMGFGSNFERTTANGNPVLVPAFVSGTSSLVAIDITQETDAALSVITIPAECDHFDIVYFARSGFAQSSYWVGTDGVYRPFTAANTPLSNFIQDYQADGFINVESQDISNTSFKKIVFGDDYDYATATPASFLARMPNLVSVVFPKNTTAIPALNLYNANTLSDFFIPSSVTAIGDYMLVRSPLKRVVVPSLVERIGNAFLSINANLEYLELPTSLKYLGVNNSDVGRMCRNCPSLREIQINSFDASLSTILGTNCFTDTPNVSTSILRADTQALADAFKAKFPAVSNWTIVINE